jgi:hypothetical protein
MKTRKLLIISILFVACLSLLSVAKSDTGGLAEIPGVDWPAWDNATPAPQVVFGEPIHKAQDQDHQRVNRHRSFAGRLIEPLGITTLSLLVLTGISRLSRRKLPKPLVRSHKRLGIITIIFALIHAALVIIIH